MASPGHHLQKMPPPHTQAATGWTGAGTRRSGWSVWPKGTCIPCVLPLIWVGSMEPEHGRLLRARGHGFMDRRTLLQGTIGRCIRLTAATRVHAPLVTLNPGWEVTVLQKNTAGSYCRTVNSYCHATAMNAYGTPPIRKEAMCRPECSRFEEEGQNPATSVFCLQCQL